MPDEQLLFNVTVLTSRLDNFPRWRLGQTPTPLGTRPLIDAKYADSGAASRGLKRVDHDCIGAGQRVVGIARIRSPRTRAGGPARHAGFQ